MKAFTIMPLALLASSLLAFISSGCAVRPGPGAVQPLELTRGPVRAVIENADWVVIRGVSGPDNFIGTVTNMPFSHASVYDAENDEVIESDRHGVHRTPLDDYLASASRVWILKPVWATPETRPLAVKAARALVGRPYDFPGLIGLDMPDSYYCSELALSVWRPFMGASADKTNPVPLVISPGRLHHWGRVVYDSLETGLGSVPAPGASD